MVKKLQLNLSCFLNSTTEQNLFFCSEIEPLNISFFYKILLHSSQIPFIDIFCRRKTSTLTKDQFLSTIRPTDKPYCNLRTVHKADILGPIAMLTTPFQMGATVNSRQWDTQKRPFGV